MRALCSAISQVVAGIIYSRYVDIGQYQVMEVGKNPLTGIGFPGAKIRTTPTRGRNMGIILRFPARHARASLKPKTDGSISCPLARTAREKAKECFAGIKPRPFQLETEDSQVFPANVQAAPMPPTAAITSSTVDSMLMKADHKSQSVSQSSPHNLCLGNICPISSNCEAMYSQTQAAKRLVQTQLALELTNIAISEKLGVASNAWAQYRTAKRAIPYNVLVKLKEQFGVTADWILAGDPSGLPQRLYAKIRIAA